MAKLVFGINQSLDGYVDHMAFGPVRPALFRHFIEETRGKTGSVYGRRMYEVMRYRDDDLADWDADEREFAAVWRNQPGTVSVGRATRPDPSLPPGHGLLVESLCPLRNGRTLAARIGASQMS